MKNKSTLIASTLLILFLVASVWLVLQYAETERERDMFNWQDRLAILSESQKRTIEGWLNDQVGNLQELADNPLMQLYLSLKGSAGAADAETERGQFAHLRNLVVATARRAGVFSAGLSLSANVETAGNDGIGVLDAGGQLLMSTRNFPVSDEALERAVDAARERRRASVHGIYRNAVGQPRLIIAVPVTPVQVSGATSGITGYVVAVINPVLSLYTQVSQHWLATVSDEALLVTGDEHSTVYVSPLKDGHELFHRVSADNDRLAANFARGKPGAFGVRRDYRGVEVLVTGRSIERTGWTLVQKIDAREALRESRAYQSFVLTVFLLAVFIVALSFIAIWRHSTSLRLQRATERLAARTALLNSVGDNIREHIILLGEDENILYINRSLSESVGVPAEDIIGRSLHHILSIETTEQLLQLKRVEGRSDIRGRVMQLCVADEDYFFHVSMLTLKQGDYKDAVLYVLHDITGLKRAQEKHSRMLEGIIATLVHAVDMHDPHCAHHSERTREVAIAIARAMDMSEDDIRALSMAALLANIGKLYLPRNILTKMEPLTAEEEALLHSHIEHAVEILRDLEFDGPVIDIIRQKNECLDGSGYPRGLNGDAIRAESRILGVANAFVAMTSSRAYRKGLPIEAVLDKLLAEADVRYDRNVIAALFHVAENRSDWKRWQVISQAGGG